jgi:multiple sugar transport system substrate-binding protein
MKRLDVMKKKIIPVLLWCCILMLCIGAKKATHEKKQLEITIWGEINEVKIIKETVKIFQKKHPDVEVVLTHAPQGQGYLTSLLTRAASGSLPDILFCEVNFVDQFISKGILMDIAPMLKQDKELKAEDYFPEILNRFKKGDKLYGLPRDVAPFATIFYNKDLFDAEGLPYPRDDWNTDQFLEAAKKLTKTDKNGTITRFGFYSWDWWGFVYAFGGKVVDDLRNPTRCLLNSREAIQGIQYYKDLMYKYKVMPFPGQNQMGHQEMFKNQLLAMCGPGIWDTPGFRSIKTFKWDVVMFPKGPNNTRGFASGGSGYSMSANTKYPELAWELLKAMSGEYGQRELAEYGLAQPALIKLAYGDSWAKDKHPPLNKGMLNEAVKYIVYRPFLPNWNEIDQKFIGPNLDSIFNNNANIQKTMEIIVRDVDAELKKTR